MTLRTTPNLPLRYARKWEWVGLHLQKWASPKRVVKRMNTLRTKIKAPSTKRRIGSICKIMTVFAFQITLAAILSVVSAGNAVAQHVTSSSVSPSSFSGPGQSITFSFNINSGTSLYNGVSASGFLVPNYSCSPQSSGSLNVNIT